MSSLPRPILDAATGTLRSSGSARTHGGNSQRSLHPRNDQRRILRACLGALALGAGVESAPAQLNFNFVPAVGMDPQAIAGFQAAGRRWSSVLADNITININIDFTTLGPGILAQTGVSDSQYS